MNDRHAQLKLFSDWVAEDDTPFTNRVVCMAGRFRQSQQLLQQKIRDMGADYKPSARVTRNTHYLLLGEGASPEQLENLRILNYNGYYPRVLRQPEVDDLLLGHYSEHRVPETICKNLHLTIAHYLQSQLDFGLQQNPLYTKEIYVAPDTEMSQETLFQKMGDKGIYANTYIDDSTDVIVISDATLLRMQTGMTDEVLQYIESIYNKSRSQSYRYVMTTESELLTFLSK